MNSIDELAQTALEKSYELKMTSMMTREKEK